MMNCIREVNENVYWIGGNDRRLSLFENIFPIPRGISYNAYVVLDEKTILLDTVDWSIGHLFLIILKQHCKEEHWIILLLIIWSLIIVHV